jgi:hypothetical protein
VAVASQIERQTMNLREKLKQAVYWVFMGVLLSAFALQAQAACTFFDAFQDNKDGTVTDPRNGLIWKRCAEGFEWKGNSCVGSARPVTWFDAMKIAKKDRFQNKRDWRVPTKAEFEDVVGNLSDCRGNNFKNAEFAASNFIAHSLTKESESFAFWSSTTGPGNAENAWATDFSSGHRHLNTRSTYNFYVRLVRAGQFSSNYASSEFMREYERRVEPGATKNEESQKSQLASALGLRNFTDIQDTIAPMKRGEYAAVNWRTISQLPSDSNSLYSSDLLDPNEYVLAALTGLIKSEQKIQITTLPSEPSIPRDFASRRSELIKGEFESTAQFNVRQAASDAVAQTEFDRDQRAFEVSKREYAAAVRQQVDTQVRVVADRNDPEKYKALAGKYLPQAVALALGNPLLSDVIYDADKQVFNAVLKSSRGTFKQAVTVAASRIDAPKLKQDLLSQKIAPVVTLQLPSLAATWVLQENVSLRSERFAQASNSSSKLFDAISEYPNSAEANAARQRMPKVQREEYDAAVRSNSSSAYHSFINNFAGADTQKLLPQAEKAKQIAAQREERERQAKEAQERRDQAARDEQYRRDAPAREARARTNQMCEAQKQSCKASCPAYNYDAKSFDANRTHFQCESRCSQISCN